MTQMKNKKESKFPQRKHNIFIADLLHGSGFVC